MRKLIIALTLVASTVFVHAQQTPQYSQYMVNPFLYNPALAGSEDYVDIKVGHREQWRGLDNAPRTTYLSAHAPIKEHTLRHGKNDKSTYPGVGGYLMRDQTGPIQNLKVNGTFSYNLPISDGSWYGALHHSDGVRLTLGASVGVNQYKIDGAELITEQINDPSIAGRDLSKISPDASLGAWLYFSDKFYVGASANQVLNSKVKFKGVNLANDPSVLGRLTPHYNMVAGGKFQVGYDLYMMPSFMVKKVIGAPFSFDLNTRVDYMDMYYGGVSYRHQDAVVLLAGVVLGEKKTIEIAYSYDITISNIAKYSNGTHEITLGYHIMPHYHARNAGGRR